MARSWQVELRLRWIVLRVGWLKCLEGAVVGKRGKPGTFYRFTLEALRDGEKADFVQWLSDKRSPVRALGAICLLATRSDDLYVLLKPVVDDRTPIQVCWRGLVTSEVSLAQLVMMVLNRPACLGYRPDFGR